MKPLQSKRAFTLVELLVVIAIIGVLVGMLLPAVQAARGSARRMSCSSKLHQFGLSLLNYESARRSFPPTDVRTGSNAGWSLHARLLPYAEESALADKFDFTVVPFTGPYTGQTPDARFAALFATPIPTLLCPADPAPAVQKSGSYAYGGNNYMVSFGSATVSGANTYWEFSKPTDGIVYENSKVKIAKITDGTSKTFMVGESREITRAAWIDGQNAWLLAVKSNGNIVAATTGITGGTLAILDNQSTAGSYDNLGGSSGSTDFGEPSNHQAGITLFTYADGHVGQVTPEIDPMLMKNLHSRGGSEATSDQP